MSDRTASSLVMDVAELAGGGRVSLDWDKHAWGTGGSGYAFVHVGPDGKVMHRSKPYPGNRAGRAAAERAFRAYVARRKSGKPEPADPADLTSPASPVDPAAAGIVAPVTAWVVGNCKFAELESGFANVYDASGKVVIVAAEVAPGDLSRLLMRARYEHGVTNPGVTVFQTKEQALFAAQGAGSDNKMEKSQAALRRRPGPSDAGASGPIKQVNFYDDEAERQPPVDVDWSTMEYELQTSGVDGGTYNEYAFEVTGLDGKKYDGVVYGDDHVMDWSSAEIWDSAPAVASQTSPLDRMYDLNKKLHYRTPEEEKELGDLIKQHGRPKYMSRDNGMTRKAGFGWSGFRDNNMAFHAGRNAFTSGKPRSSNPGGRYANAWDDGWVKASGGKPDKSSGLSLFYAGRRAFIDGVTQDHNPYGSPEKAGSAESLARAWEEGWLQASEEGTKGYVGYGGGGSTRTAGFGDLTADEYNDRTPRVMQAEMDWEYHGRDQDGEKTYEPYVTVLYRTQDGAIKQESFFGADSETQYREWARGMGMQAIPIKKESHEDWAAERAQWDQEYDAKERESMEEQEAAKMDALIDSVGKPNRASNVNVVVRLAGAKVKYRGYTIEHDPPPVPIQGHDYRFVADDYDGAPDSMDRRAGHAATVEEAVDRIDEIEADLNNPSGPSAGHLGRGTGRGQEPLLADPLDRMYDLSNKGHRRTPEEEAEMADLIKRYGRPKFMSSYRNMTRLALQDHGQELSELVAAGKLEEVDDGAYMVLGVPGQFGEWFIQMEESGDGRGGYMDAWRIYQDSGADGSLWETKDSPTEAWTWVMRNYANPDNPYGQDQAAPQPVDPHDRMYDLNKKTQGRTPEEEQELGDLISRHGRPKYMSKEKAMTKKAMASGPHEYGMFLRLAKESVLAALAEFEASKASGEPNMTSWNVTKAIDQLRMAGKIGYEYYKAKQRPGSMAKAGPGVMVRMAAGTDVRYRGYVIQYSPPPIPHRGADWQFAHEDYDGAPGSGDSLGSADRRVGTAGSLEQAMAQIDEMIGDSENHGQGIPPTQMASWVGRNCKFASKAVAAGWDDEGDRDDFADPGGQSALRADRPGNKRTLPCPTCGRPNKLTPKDKRLGYQCDSCADAAERGAD